MLFDDSIAPVLEPPTTEVTKLSVTEDPPPVTVSFRSPNTPVPVAVKLAAAPTPLPLFFAVAAPALVDLDTADVEVADSHALGQPHFPTQHVHLFENFDDSLPNDTSQNPYIVSEAPVGIDPVEQKLPLEAIPNDRQLSRHLLHLI